jgi:hypothetical protein
MIGESEMIIACACEKVKVKWDCVSVSMEATIFLALIDCQIKG